MATIAKLSVLLEASAGGFAATLESASKSVTKLGSTIAESALVMTGWATAIGAIATGGGLGALVASQMEAIDSTAKLADRLNASTQGLVALQHEALMSGVNSDQLTEALEKMQKALGGTTAEGASTADVFSKLGLKAQELAGMTADQAFGKIADAIGKLPNAFDRANAEVTIFGKSGQKIDALMRQGAAGMAAASLEAQKLGISFSRVDAAKVELANDAMSRAGEVFTGIGRTAAIEVAPYIEAAADKFTEFATQGEGASGLVRDGIQLVEKGILKATDYVGLFSESWHAVAAAAEQAFSEILSSASIAEPALNKLASLATGIDVKINLTSNQAEQMAKAAAEQAAQWNKALQDFQSGAISSSLKGLLDGIVASGTAGAQAIADQAAKMNSAAVAAGNMAGKIDDISKAMQTLADLQKQVDQAGMSDLQKKLDDFERLDGVTKEQIASAEKLLGIIDKQKATQALANKIKGWVDSIKTPLEIYNENMADLQKALNEGLISMKTFSQIKGKLQNDEIAAEKKPLSFIDAHSAAADRLQYEASNDAAARFALDQQAPGIAKMNSDKDIPKQQLDAQKISNTALQKIQQDIHNIMRGNSDSSLQIVDDF